MITENQLNEAIAEMNGQRHPNAETCIKLASYYTIKNELFPKNKPQIDPEYSFDAPPVTNNNTIDYYSDTDFGRAVSGRDVNEIMQLLDDTMSALYVVNPPLYNRIMRDLSE